MATRKVSSQLFRCKSFISRNSRSLSNYSTTQLFQFLFLVLSSLIFILPLNTAHAAQVTLAWNQNAEENVVGYNVYYGNTSGNYDWVLDVGNVTSITITELSDGLMYYFTVTAYDDSSPSLESTYSNEVSKNTCSYSISPTSASLTASGGTGTVGVTTQAGCPWTASSVASWMTITSGSSGTGNGTISYSVPANASPDSRTASSTFASKVFTVTQSGATTYTITASAGTGGTITPSGTVTVAHGASQTFNIAANNGYQISNVTVDGTSIGAVNSYTFSNVTAGHTISATFSVKSYTITSSAGTGGTITPSGSVSVNHGSNQSYTISANTGYQISNVTVDGTSIGAVSSYTFSNVSAGHTISATFSVITYTINASAGTGGSISPSGSVSVSYSTNRTFTINANTGYTIANVLVDGVSVGAVSSYTFSNVIAAHTISASFTANTYTITASAGNGGSISPSGNVTVSHGSNQSFTITANTGFQISNVTVNGVSQGAISSYIFSNVSANHTITASFAVKTYTITASAGTGGTISPSGSVSVNHGANQSFTITANAGYQIASVTIDGVSQGALSSYTFSNVTAAHTISATFSAVTYTITASAGTGGSINPSGSVSVNHGANQTFAVTSNTGYGVSYVLVDGVSVGAVSSYTFSNVIAAHTISASFTANTYTITATAGTGGTISPSGAVAVNGGSNQTFTITPLTGYRITDVLVDGSSVGAVSSFTFTNINASRTISASFAANTYTITAAAGVGGTISPSGSVSVNHGSSQSYTVTANTGYQISNVTVDGVSQGAVSSYTFSNVTANHTIAATFSVKTYTITASASTGGSISPSGSTSLNHGANQTFTITPNTGYSIATVTVDGVSQGAISSYTFSNVTANHTISATFSVNTFTIAASAGPGGAISPSGNVTVPYGGSQTFTITPASGYAISDVLVDGVSHGVVGIHAFGNVTAHHTISARFSQITYTIQASAETGGTITPSGAVSVGQGAQQTFAINADSGYVVSNVVVDGSSLGALGSYTFTNVSSSHTISVSFAQGYTLTVTKAGTGTGNIATNPSATVYPPGAKVTMKAIKADSSLFLGFSGDCNTYRTSCSVIMNKNTTVTATFKLKTLKVKTLAIGNGTVSLTGPVSAEDGKVTQYLAKKKQIMRSEHEIEVDYGNQLVYSITPEAGNYIKRVVVDGKSQGSINALTFTNVKRNHTVKVRFESETQLSKNAQFETNKQQMFLRDEEEREDLQTFTDDLVENDDNDKPINNSSFTTYYASVKK